jgi:hypothetical protein
MFMKHTKSFTFSDLLESQSAHGSAAAKRLWKQTKSFTLRTGIDCELSQLA